MVIAISFVFLILIYFFALHINNKIEKTKHAIEISSIKMNKIKLIANIFPSNVCQLRIKKEQNKNKVAIV